jgi:hypothetical protein
MCHKYNRQKPPQATPHIALGCRKFVTTFLLLWLIVPIAQASNKPCSGSKGGVARCEGKNFICNDGSYSASKFDCSVTQNFTLQTKQRVIQCFLELRVITPQHTRFTADYFRNNNAYLP